MPATLFSPAKMVYIGYLVLAGLQRINTSLAQFIVISVVFFLAQVYHDDFWRIRLNILAAQTAGRK